MALIQAFTQHANDSSSRSTPLQLSVIEFPNELVDAIFGFLNGQDQICFALTRRTLYTNYFPKTSKYYRRAKSRFWIQNLLFTLEKDSPDYYYCVQRNLLRRWDTPLKTNRSGRENWKGYLGLDYSLDDYGYHEFPVGEDHCLTIHAVRVVMNHHLYGPRHGMPLEAIELDTTKWCSVTGVTVDMSMRPRIIDDNLFLSVRHKMLYSEEDPNNLKVAIDETKWRVCRHLQIGEYWTGENCWSRRKIGFLPHRIPELKSEHFPPQDRASELVGNVWSCSICMTDYQVNISRPDDGQGKRSWSIEVAVWHQLGNGRNRLGEDGPWFNLACEEYPGGNGRQSPPGIVRHRWSQGDAALLEIEGEFVEGLDRLPKRLTTDREGNVVFKGDYDHYGDYYCL